jgi:hypothetical protein
VAVITASVDGSKIALIQGTEIGYETFAGEYAKVYDANLNLLKTIPLSPPDAEGRTVEPLHHRDPSLAVTDKYVAVATEDDGYFGSGGAQQYVSVYEINGDKANHLKVFSGTAGGARGTTIGGIGGGNNPALMGIAMSGNYLLVGGNAGTAIYKIDNNTLALTQVGTTDTADGGCHWFKDNGSYVLESKTGAGAGKVRVWRWNGASAPSAVGTVDINETGSGSIQALSFDPDNSARAYVYCRVAAYDTTTQAPPAVTSPNAGHVYSVNLTTATKELLFEFPTLVITTGTGTSATTTIYPLSGLWNIEKQTSGSSEYYVFSGSYALTGGTTVGGIVLTIKNPTLADSPYGNAGNTTTPAVDPRVGVQTFTAPFATAIRTLKTFKTTSGVYYAAKNYTSGGTGVFSSSYKLVLERLD